MLKPLFRLEGIYTFYWPGGEEETRAFIASAIRKAQEVPCVDYQYAAVSKATGVLIGSCNFALSDQGGSNMGWIIHSDYWGQGYGTEMGRAMLRLGFEECNLPRIIACCDAENVASWRVMEKIGMRREGLFLDCRRPHKQSKREYSDEVTYAISRDAWRIFNGRQLRE